MAQQGISANRLELLQIADAVAREKSIDRTLVLSAMEDAIQKAAKSRYGSENEIRAEIDPRTGEIRLTRLLEVVEKVTFEATEISVKDAKRRNPEAEVGDFIAEPLPPLDFGRVAAQNAKQVIVQKVREAERDRQFDEYKDRVGEIVSGIVKRVEYGNVVVDLGRAESVIRRDETLPRELYKLGDRVRAFVYDVRRENRGPQIFLSRTRPEFMVKLFAQEVPEIYDGIVEIKSVARDPGSRAKIAVTSKDSSIDPVGACVGMRGSRVQAVVNELQGEKIDIIQWSPDAATFIVNALAPAEVAKVVLDEDSERIEVVVPDEQLSLAIGRRGQNVRLASQLTGWDIDILTEAEESERRQKEFADRTNAFVNALDVDEMIAQLLVSEGFANVEELAYVELPEIAAIEGFDEATAEEIQSRAREFLERQDAEMTEKRRALGVEDELADVEGVTSAMLVALGENGVKTLEDLADCATDDLAGWQERGQGQTKQHPGILQGFGLDREQIEAIILNARVKAGWIEAPVEEPEETEAAKPARRICWRRMKPRRRRSRANSPSRMVMPMRQKKTRIDEEPVLDFHETGHDVKSVADSTFAAPSSPIRTCVVARERRSDSELLRFVLSPDGDVVPDLKRKLPGRGVWLTPGRDKVLEAVRRRAFDRGFRQKVKAGPELADLVQQLMQRAAVESLSLANKAGLAITGFEKLSHAIGRGEILVLVHAAGASPEGVTKLNGRLARSLGEKSYIEPIICLTSAEIGLATGRPNVIHAGLKEGGASRAFLQAIQRLLRYQGQPRQAGLPVQDEV